MLLLRFASLLLLIHFSQPLFRPPGRRIDPFFLWGRVARLLALLRSQHLQVGKIEAGGALLVAVLARPRAPLLFGRLIGSLFDHGIEPRWLWKVRPPHPISVLEHFQARAAPDSEAPDVRPRRSGPRCTWSRSAPAAPRRCRGWRQPPAPARSRARRARSSCAAAHRSSRWNRARPA